MTEQCGYTTTDEWGHGHTCRCTRAAGHPAQPDDRDQLAAENSRLRGELEAIKRESNGFCNANAEKLVLVDELQARVVVLTEALRGLVAEWDADVLTYPHNSRGDMARASVQCCARELRAALAAGEEKS